MRRGEDLDTASAHELLRELERNKSEEIRRARAYFRIEVKAAVWLLPGNVSETLRYRLQGVTGDVSEGGCQALFPMPVAVGDVFRLQFDADKLGIPTTYARCTRCRLLREDAYEAGFKFFSLISLPGALESGVAAADEGDLL